ncbi:MAG: isocitrate/isopropylmalate dehydrogenase family protein [Rhodococcus sp.]|nr:isocitrate/isopropylmalate dehydrogenase family protein [Rhodococcus sp. (in: high G+C Gram-positive bacteria)]
MMGSMSDRVELGVMVGDGIGREIVPATQRVMESAAGAYGLAIDWVPLELGFDAIASSGTAVPQATLDALVGLDAWIMGPHDSAAYPKEVRGDLAPGGVVRKTFNLFANVRPAAALPGVAAMSPNMDLVIVRENTEGLYADRNMAVGSGEFMPTPDIALAVGVFTRSACERIAHTAFELARTRRRHVTIVHKANVLTMTTGLFRDVCRQVGEQYPDVEVDDFHVDALAAHLVRRGADFDVIVAENMFGDILSDLTAELSGSLGTAPSLNMSETQAMAQAAHGAAPDIAGKNRANPTAMLLSSAMLLEWLGSRQSDERLAHAGSRIRQAVDATVASGVATADLGGQASTAEFTEIVDAHTRRR